MKLRLLWVGKTRAGWLRDGIDEYAGRLRRYVPLEIVEVKEEKGLAPGEQRLREGERLARAIPPTAQLILLDERGEEPTSPELAAFIGKSRDSGVPELAFVIGGAYGFSDELRSRAHRLLALSRLTLTHEMARVVLLEQLYRGFTILNNEPYHH